MNRTDRLMGILLEFQAHGERRAEDLARAFEVSVRTVYRDVEALCEAGVPVVATPGKGYRLLDGYFLPPLSFTSTEAALLLLGGEYLRRRLDPELRAEAETALKKLAAVLPAEKRADVARWLQELCFPGFGERPARPSQALLRRAIRERRVVRLLYHAYLRPASEERDVEPVSLIYGAGAWHLAGWCRLRRAPRFFHLDRIDRLEVLEERFVRGGRHAAIGPESGDALSRFPEARVRFDAAALRWARERQPYLFLREEADLGGEPVFVYALRDERELLGWLLQWGAAAEVLEPAALCERLATEARALLERYAPVEQQNILSEPPRAPATTLSGTLA
ncbi:MAG TPA: YafY family protein [Dehalococcoidia bacterium]|nr:YafY family protein [Dehalococcoidia bacterium]